MEARESQADTDDQATKTSNVWLKAKEKGAMRGLEKPRLEGIRGMISTAMDLVGQAIGGDSILEGLQELVDNADVASIDKCIAMLQAHRSGADQATIEVLQKANRVP